jgi:leucyl aminopeptidase (aminopeptidase T)
MVEKYVRQALETCLSMTAEDAVLIVTDEETASLGEVFRDVATRIAPDRTHHYFVMESFGERGGETPLAFPQIIAEKLGEVDVSVYAARSGQGELASFRLPLLEAVKAVGRIRHGHMPGVSAETLELGFGDDYRRVVKLTARVFEIVQDARRARVTSSLGTDLSVEFNPAYRWVKSDAIIGPGEWGNIPSGEVFTCVETCSGTLVVDGEVGDYLCSRYGVLADTPVTIQIDGGRAVSVACDNPALVADLEQYFRIDENANRVGEFAVGTNINVTRLIGNMLLDEKYPGMHVAFGSGYPERTGATWTGKGHLDCVVTKPTIVADEWVIMERGAFLLDM